MVGFGCENLVVSGACLKYNLSRSLRSLGGYRWFYSFRILHEKGEFVMATFHHYGVPVDAKQADEIYIEGAKVFITDCEKHPYGVEYLRFEADSPMHEDVQKKTHAAFVVDSLDEALKGQNVIVEPFDATDTLRVAFINDNGAVIELMETR